MKSFLSYHKAGVCPNDNWNGDGYCDDGNNIPECKYDLGDCCGKNVITQYCTECLCHESAINTTSPDTGECEGTTKLS